MDTSEIEWTNPLLTNDIRLKLACGFEANHKMKDKPQTLLSFVRKIPNHNEAKWTLPVFGIVQGKSSPK
mgnify:CR=1 FL=1